MNRYWLVSTVLCGALALPAATSAGERQDRRQRMVQRIVDRMADKLVLNEKQTQEVRKLFNASFDEMRQAWENRGERSWEALRAKQQQLLQKARQQVVPLLEPDQLKLYANELATQAKDRATVAIEAVRDKLGLAEDDWANLEAELKKLADLKAQLSAKVDVARGELRKLLDEREGDLEAIGKKLDEIATIKKDLGEKIDELLKTLRKRLTQNQWAQLIVEGVVE